MKKFWTEVFISTLFVFVLMWGIYRITQLNFFNAFDSIGKALGDVDLTDYVFWGLRDAPLVDENIVIVNIGRVSRREIAEQIRIISKYKPKAIGIDSFFCGECPQEDEFGNALLSEAIRDAGNVVMVTKIEQTEALRKLDEDRFDSLGRSAPMFSHMAYAEGFANLDTDAAFQDDVKTCRAFPPQKIVADKNVIAFSVVLASMYDSLKAKRFLQRGNDLELINYRGNVVDMFGQSNEDYRNMFYSLDVNQVLEEDFDESLLSGKIVLMGFLGKEFGDSSWEDRFYTPLSMKLAGKSNPDMFGVVIHANIISMILNEAYLDSMEEWQEFAMAFIICFLNMALFSLIYRRLPDWYDGISKLLQVIQLFAFTVLMVLIFHWFSFKLDVTLTLAAIALAGDTFEIFEGVLKNTYLKTKSYFGLTKQPENVLTP